MSRQREVSPEQVVHSCISTDHHGCAYAVLLSEHTGAGEGRWPYYRITEEILEAALPAETFVLCESDDYRTLDTCWRLNTEERLPREMVDLVYLSHKRRGEDANAERPGA